MAKKNIIIRIFLIILCIAFAGGIVYLLMTIENEKMALQEGMRKLALSKQGLASVVTYLEDTNATLEKKIKESKREIKELTAQCSEEKNNAKKLAQELEAKEKEIEHAETNIETYKEEKKEMLENLKFLDVAFNEIKAEYEEAENAKMQTEKELEELNRIVKDLSRKDSTSLGTMVIR